MATYNFVNVIEDHTIVASFKVIVLTITASAGANGSITPLGDVSVNYGSDQEFTITPSTGYEVDEILVDGVPV